MTCFNFLHQDLGKPEFIRTDANPAHETIEERGFFRCTEAPEIIEEMKTATQIRYRFMRWPFEKWIDTKIPAYGFSQALDLLEWSYDQIAPVQGSVNR